MKAIKIFKGAPVSLFSPPPSGGERKVRGIKMDAPYLYREVMDEEKRRRVAAELAADPTRSTRAIAKAAGVSQSTAFRVRKELEVNGDAALVATKKKAPKIMNGISGDKYKVAREELIKDPKRSNHVIAAVSAISADTVRHLRGRMERAGEIPTVPHTDRVNAAGRLGHITGAGSKINVPDDISLMQLASKGLLLEEENPDIPVEEVSLLLGISTETYRDLRIIRLLSMRDDISKSDAAIVREVVDSVEAARQVAPFFPKVEKLAEKIWGKRMPGRRKSEVKRKRSFNHAVGLIFDMCSRGPEVDIPYLTETEQIAVLHRLTEAINCLKQLGTNIRRVRG